MQVECKHCGYIWDYKGSRTVANCPKCGYKVFFSLMPAPTRKKFEELRVKSNKICICSDLHVPYHDSYGIMLMTELCRMNNITDLAVVGDFLDMEVFSNWKKEQEPNTWATEKLSGKLLVEHFEKHFKNIYACVGNHEARLLKLRDGQLSLEDIYNMLEVNWKKWKVTEADHIYVETAMGTWRLCHPLNYSQIKLSVAQKLAAKYHAHIVNTHGHFTAGPTLDQSGTYFALDIGGLYIPGAMPYEKRTSTYPRHIPGFVILINGYPYVFFLEFLKRARKLPKIPEIKVNMK